MKRTSLYPLHKKQGAKLIPFAGFEMPVWYSNFRDFKLCLNLVEFIYIQSIFFYLYCIYQLL